MSSQNQQDPHSPSQGPWPWVREGLRGAVWRRPRLEDVHASPWVLALLALASIGIGVLLQRAAVAGAASFYWEAITSGWLTTALLLWVCWLVVRRNREVTQKRLELSPGDGLDRAPSGSATGLASVEPQAVSDPHLPDAHGPSGKAGDAPSEAPGKARVDEPQAASAGPSVELSSDPSNDLLSEASADLSGEASGDDAVELAFDRALAGNAALPPPLPAGPPRPGAATLFGVLVAQQMVISTPLWLIYLGVLHFGLRIAPKVVPWLLWGIPLVVVAWVALAGMVFLWRQTVPASVRLVVVSVFVLTGLLDVWAPSTQFWYPDEVRADVEDMRPHLTQDALEAQSSAVIQALNAVQPERPGVIDLYGITFAPYAGEEVFRREVTMVGEVMRKRFDAEGHLIQLQNHAKTLSDVPWATPLNMQRAIQRMAAVMNRDEDILFIHLTSHGAQDGKLSANFRPIEVESVTPQDLRTWLDAAGIRYRVISVSACYAGAWVAPLSEPGTLMMTASDADHTSYGCGRKSDLTFFGRAMYDEQLRNGTRSFEVAHQAAREVIARREQEAGKTDGYSNPQISVGELIRPKLADLKARLEAAGEAQDPAAPPPN